MTRILTLFGFIWLCVGSLSAQSLTKQADRHFDQLAYAKAVELYEQALVKPTALSDEERRSAKARLGYSYQQMRDMANAERVYRELIGSGDLPTEYTPWYLYYAQTLAGNGKYAEAQQVYERYSALQTSDKRGPVFSKLYRDVSALTKNAGSYTVEFLSMNTRKAEFSPMVYKDGLVFVSAGNEGNGIKRVFKWNNTPYLDLYYLPEASALRGSKAASLGGSESKKRTPRTQLVRPLGRDDYTAPTANDSRTVGFYGGNNISMGYEDRPVSESERFSRSLNTKYHEGPATFTQNGSRVIFTRNNYNEGQFRKSSDGVNKLKLYTATQTNGTWSAAEELPFNSDEFSTGHPSLSKNDQLLYFASDRPGGFGGTDIYVSKWTNGKWAEPVNLGKEVNSKGNELFPFVDEKGNLYVASDGHAGLGGLDLFYAPLDDNGQRARSLRNLGEPFSSAQDDFGIVTDGERKSGYFSSNRKHGGDDDDVYRFTREGSLFPCRELTVSVFDADSKMPLVNTSVAVESPVADKQKQLRTDADGLVRICLDEDSEFKFLASRDGYLPNKVGFSTKDLSDDQPSRIEIPLMKPKEIAEPSTRALRGRVLTQADRKPVEGATVISINECDGKAQQTTSNADGSYSFTVQLGCAYRLEAKKGNLGNVGSRVDEAGIGSTDLFLFKKGDVIKIDNIYYDLNKATIRPDAAVELDKVVGLMTKYPKMTIEMRSHTDSRATAQYNKTLSGNRAKSAVAYLKSKGISPKRMVAKGYGESKLLNNCKDGVDCPEDEHQQNRRTEIKILKME